MTFDPIFIYANYAEAGLWVGLGIWAIIRAKGTARWVLAGSLVAFGVSDIVETRTGAWYNPWWLLAWKAACVILILLSGASVRKRGRRSKVNR